MGIVPTEVTEIENNGWHLGQIYPNPVSGNASISFSVPDATYVSLKVYNILGTEITELAGREYPAGSHKAEFDATNLPRGIYMYTIRAGKFAASQKMTIQTP